MSRTLHPPTSSSQADLWRPRASTTASSSRAARPVVDGVARKACRRMREGLIGDRLHGAGVLQNAQPIGRTPVSEVPRVGLRLWTGPAPKRPFSKTGSTITGTGSGIPEATSATGHSRDGQGALGWASSIRSRPAQSAGRYVRRRSGRPPTSLNASSEFNENGKTKILEFEVATGSPTANTCARTGGGAWRWPRPGGGLALEPARPDAGRGPGGPIGAL